MSEEQKQSYDFSEYRGLIQTRLKKYLITHKIKQNKLAESCGLSPASISKLLNSDNCSMDLDTLFLIAGKLQINISDLLTTNHSVLDDESNTAAIHARNQVYISQNAQLVTNPSFYQFKGLLGDYYFYCRPTISTERHLFLQGILSLRAVTNSSDPYCESTLRLFTGDPDPETGKITEKHYTGNLIISQPTSSCFTMMYSPNHADFCCLNWQYLYLNSQKLSSRVVACLTSSAGSSRRPVMLKAFISRHELTTEQLLHLSGQLAMTSSTITVKRRDFADYIIPLLSKDNGNDIALLETTALKEPMLSWSEDDIISKKDQFSAAFSDILYLLRQYSTSQPYTKISSNANNMLHNYIESQFKKDKEVSDDQRIRDQINKHIRKSL